MREPWTRREAGRVDGFQALIGGRIRFAAIGAVAFVLVFMLGFVAAVAAL
jgi:hypothetical protein